MTDCANVEVRELLPDLVNGTLPAGDRARVEAHVQGCVACAGELALLRAARRELRPAVPVDVARIVAALPPAPIRRRDVGTRRSAVASQRGRRLRTAAALLVVAGGGAGVLAVRGEREPTPVAVNAASPAAPGEAPPARRELLVASGITELDDAALASLLSEIEALGASDALPSAEPRDVVPPLLEEEGA